MAVSRRAALQIRSAGVSRRLFGFTKLPSSRLGWPCLGQRRFDQNWCEQALVFSVPGNKLRQYSILLTGKYLVSHGIEDIFFLEIMLLDQYQQGIG